MLSNLRLIKSATTSFTTTTFGFVKRSKTTNSRRTQTQTTKATQKKTNENQFFEEFKRQLDLTFNPRTNGAKIAGRCPDTQTIETEIDRMNVAGEDDDARRRPDFNETRFSIELARTIRETSMNVNEEDNKWDEALKRVIVLDSDSDRNARASERDAECVIDEFEDATSSSMAVEGTFAIEDELPLTGRELALLCYGKYDKFHDMAVKHVKMGANMSKWVSLNLYVGHLAQRSYPQTEREYIERLDAIAYMISSWNQAGYTRRWFAEKPIARRGLPSRPRVDTCVTLQFNRSETWDDKMGDEFFDY